MSALPGPGPLDVPRRTLGIRIRRVPDGLLLGYRDQAVLLSGPAELIYRLADGDRTVADIADGVAGEYGIDAAEALADVVEFLADQGGSGTLQW
ncbi:PqqD family protein [Streptomyces sp. NPDC048106]|uniref:PqqD family protein n=1 Tax=Streptomyces sp. NPDC048106 TaxID=3155750 RepID=UPI0034545DE9